MLKTINLLRTQFVALRDVRFALNGIPEGELLDSINFLQEEEYIRIRDIEYKEPVLLADCQDYTQLEAKLTGKGIRLRDGMIKDPAVVV